MIYIGVLLVHSEPTHQKTITSHTSSHIVSITVAHNISNSISFSNASLILQSVLTHHQNNHISSHSSSPIVTIVNTSNISNNSSLHQLSLFSQLVQSISVLFVHLGRGMGVQSSENTYIYCPSLFCLMFTTVQVASLHCIIPILLVGTTLPLREVPVVGVLGVRVVGDIKVIG